MLLEKIQSDLKSALKDKKEKELSTVRMLLAAVKNEEIAKRPNSLTEADISSVIKREIKKLKDGAEQFKAGGREDLASAYEAEMSILAKYLPEEMSGEKLREIVAAKIAASADKNFGAIMKAVMAEAKGQADGALVSKIVKEELGSS